MPSIGQENLETVMIDFFGALRRGDFDAAAALLDPDVRWQGLREEWVCRGREEVIDTFRWGLDERREIDALEFTRSGDWVVMGARGPSIREVGDEPLEGQIFNVFTLRDGRIVRIDDFSGTERGACGGRRLRGCGLALTAASPPVNRRLTRGRGQFRVAAMEPEPTLERLVGAVESQRAGASPAARLAAAVELGERVRSVADELVDHFVQEARAAGCSWTEIGSTLGVTKQAAQQRFVTIAPAQTWPPGLDEAAGAAFATAAAEARALGHHYIGPEHLLLGLLAQSEEMAARALQALGVTPEAVRARVLEHLRPSAPRPGGSLGVAPQTKRLLELARTLAKRLGHRCARTEHLLLAAVSPALNSPAGSVLADCGADAARVCEQLASMLEMEAPELAARLRPKRRRLRGRPRVHS